MGVDKNGKTLGKKLSQDGTLYYATSSFMTLLLLFREVSRKKVILQREIVIGMILPTYTHTLEFRYLVAVCSSTSILALQRVPERHFVPNTAVFYNQLLLLYSFSLRHKQTHYSFQIEFKPFS